MQPGNPALLGATPIADGVNFALYSAVAERVELCLFDDDGRLIEQQDLAPGDDDVWHGFMPGLAAGQLYGYRVHGEYARKKGRFCNPAKLLIDPYARRIDGAFRWHDAVFGYRPGDSAPYVPKSVVVKELGHCERPVKVPWAETVFYELNVRGYTMRHPAVDESARGRFRGLTNGEVLDYLRSLGVTSIELMPVQAFIDEHHLVTKGLRNYWGYNTVNFFAPMPRYAGDDPIAEFRDMVNAIHDAGMEVILDVAFNHTAEGDDRGPMLSFRGIDNASYYHMHPERPGEYINDTGCGNTINADHPVAQQLILDSLRYWTHDMGVDGFRFDLASVLGRSIDGFSSDHPLLRAIASDIPLKDTKLVAEPWDPGPGGYQLGSFPPAWAEWNDLFRDTARRFWRGDDKHSGELARRLHGSADLFEANGRTPSASVNLITAHDGFTLNDLVCFERRHNEANGENNVDGHSHNYSLNYGVEGDTDDLEILARRRTHRLNLLATLFASQGTPLLLAGDEFGNSQRGNNNAYAQDNEIGWLDWSGIDRDPEFVAAVRTLIGLRRQLPLLRLDRYVHGPTEVGGATVSVGWVNPDGRMRMEEDWSYGHAFGALIVEERDGVTSLIVAMLFNAWEGDLDFRLPKTDEALDWRLRFCSAGQPVDIVDDALVLPGASIALLTASQA